MIKELRHFSTFNCLRAYKLAIIVRLFMVYLRMPFNTDGVERTVVLPSTPQRIVSLVPSQTELLYHLGLGDKVVGITKFCVHPPDWYRTKSRIGGTKTVDISKVRALNPDLILAAKEENVKEQVEELSHLYPVWMSDVQCLNDAIEMIYTIGAVTGSEGHAHTVASEIQTAFDMAGRHAGGRDLSRPPQGNRPSIRAAYLIWNDPLMAAGGDTFINDMMQHAGYENIFREKTRYPVVSPGEIAQLDCDVLLLSSEPYPFGSTHIAHFQQLLPVVKVVLVDGEAFSWYGSRLLHSPTYFKHLYEEVTRNV